VREVHLHISRAIADNASPPFIIKYLRSFFLEDWELVRKILDIFHWRHTDTHYVIQHLQHRLKILSQQFTRKEYDAYRDGIAEAHESAEQNFEFLPGLLRDIEIGECHVISNDLLQTNYQFAPEHLDDVGQRIYGALIRLQNRMGFLAIHQGDYQVEMNGNQLKLMSGNEILVMKTTEGNTIKDQTCRVSFFLSCAGDILQRFARVHAEAGPITAWVDQGKAGAFLLMAEVFNMCEHSEAAQAYVNPRLRMLSEIYRENFDGAIREGCITSRTIFLEWLREQNGFYSNLSALSDHLGNTIPPQLTFFRLFDQFFSKSDLDLLIRHSLVYGIGYNVGEISRGKAKKQMRQFVNFMPEMEAKHKILHATKIDNFNFFYLEDEGKDYPLPRYFF
jgi:hypothetical protein